MSIPSIGVFLPSLSDRKAPVPDPVVAAVHAETLGFESAWVVDQLVAGTGNSILESTLVLAAASAVTERIRLALGVLIVPLRNAAWIAKQAATCSTSHAVACCSASAWAAMAAAAVGRAESHDGWFLLPMPPEAVAEAAARVTVPVTANQTVAIVGDPALPRRDELTRQMVDPDGLYGAPAEVVDQILLYGSPDEITERLGRSATPARQGSSSRSPQATGTAKPSCSQVPPTCDTSDRPRLVRAAAGRFRD